MTRGVSYVCISLASASERRALMTRQFRRHGLEVRFFNGIEVRDPSFDVSASEVASRIRRYGRPLSNGEIGCYLSHREVWKQLINSTDDAWCVMEDDIALCSGFDAAIRELLTHRQHWDFVRLMGLNRRDRIPYADLPSGMQLMWMDRQPVGLQGYVVTRAGAAELLRHTARIVHAIDTAVDRHWEHKLRMYVTEPEIVRAVEMESTVGYRSGVTSLSMRAREKFFRRLDKLMSAKYNAQHRPRGPIALAAVRGFDDTVGVLPRESVTA